MKLQRLRGRKVNQRVLDRGRVWRGKTMTLRVLRGAPKNPNVDPTENAVYLGTFAGTKLHKSAVKRNRMRRRCREAMRVALKEVKEMSTMQILLSPRIKSLDCSYELVRRDIEEFLLTYRA